jgi:hypothetical protein
VAQPTPAPAVPSPTPQPLNDAAETDAEEEVARTETPVIWKTSRAVGKAFAGRLVNGVELPASGRDYFTWDPILKRSPNRAWRPRLSLTGPRRIVSKLVYHDDHLHFRLRLA